MSCVCVCHCCVWQLESFHALINFEIYVQDFELLRGATINILSEVKAVCQCVVSRECTKCSTGSRQQEAKEAYSHNPLVPVANVHDVTVIRPLLACLLTCLLTHSYYHTPPPPPHSLDGSKLRIEAAKAACLNLLQQYYVQSNSLKRTFSSAMASQRQKLPHQAAHPPTHVHTTIYF